MRYEWATPGCNYFRTESGIPLYATMNSCMKEGELIFGEMGQGGVDVFYTTEEPDSVESGHPSIAL